MKTLYTLILVLLAGTAYGQGNLPACKGSDVWKWSNCFGTATYTNGDKYVGDYKDGNKHGQGTYYLLADNEFKGDRYVGEWKDDNKHGQGTYTYAKGDKYVGEYKDGKMNGQGIYTYANGNKHVGEFKDGDYNGQGILYSVNGSIKESGIYKDDKLVTSQYIDPNSFTRIARNNSSPVASDSQRQNAEQSNTQSNLPACQGSGTAKWNNCFGSRTASNGDKYVGEFKDGNYNGQGTYYYLADNKFKGDKYVGEWKDDKLNGQGAYTWADGDRYVGEWKDNKMNGQGTFTLMNGNKYVGEFKDDNRNGQNIFYSANGSIKESGIYKDDNLVTSQYIDPNSFARIARNSTAPVVSDLQRQENERKAAQLEEDRRRLEEEKRQIALERQRVDSQKNQAQIAPDNRRRFALVIGNDSYSSLPVLSNAVNDSKAMSEALKQANFEVSYYKNLSKRQMEEALNNFSKKLGKDDVGMFYFAGHGIQADSRNFLIPVSENVKKSSDVPFEGVDVDRVMASLRDSRNSLNIVVLDACRNSLDTRGGMSRGLTVTDAPQGSIVAYATSPGKTASDGDSGNSPFTKNLIRVMQRKGLKIEDVFKEVRVAVSRETNGEQVPQELSQLVSDFYFRQ